MKPMDTGLYSLIAVARFHQLPADPEQLRHQFAEPGQAFGETQLLLAAKALTLKAKSVTPKLAKLSNPMLPAMVKAADGSYFLLARILDTNATGEPQKLLIHDLREPTPRSVNLAEFTSLWSGEIILL
jgi:ATP-binding cassette, subfamily B, bacterial HlyB/CyaB